LASIQDLKEEKLVFSAGQLASNEELIRAMMSHARHTKSADDKNLL